jgi:hypothetical protein
VIIPTFFPELRREFTAEVELSEALEMITSPLSSLVNRNYQTEFVNLVFLIVLTSTDLFVCHQYN